jgi:hypothetical protein
VQPLWALPALPRNSHSTACDMVQSNCGHNMP